MAIRGVQLHSGRALYYELRGHGVLSPQVSLCCVLEQDTLTPYITGKNPGSGGSVPT